MGVSPQSLGTINSTVDIYVIPTDIAYSDADLQAILRWASYGRGIVVAGSATNDLTKNGAELPANKLLAAFNMKVRCQHNCSRHATRFFC